jgi:hypothetical protein
MRRLRLSRRRQLRSMLAAAFDVLDANEQFLAWPQRTGDASIAHLPGWCSACGTEIQVGQPLVQVHWPDGLESWIHETHPDRWEAFRENLEPSDNVIIGWIGAGRGKLEGLVSVGLRRPQSRYAGQHTDYISWDEAKEKGYL